MNSKATVFSLPILGCFLCFGMATVAAQELREWTDKSGKFKVQATFVELKDDTLLLKKKDGKTLKIRLDKLSPGDQKYVSELESENPFEQVEDNSDAEMEEGPADANDPDVGSRPKAADQGESSQSIDWSEVPSVEILGGDRWEIPEFASDTSEKIPKPVPLPKKQHFFEGIHPIVVSPLMNKAVISYATTFSVPKPAVRMVIADLTTGKMVASETVDQNFRPLALINDGQSALMCGIEAQSDQLQVWQIKGKKIQSSPTWRPFADSSDDASKKGDSNSQLIAMAEGISENLVLLGTRTGHLALWDIKTKKPVWHWEMGEMPAIGFSPDRSLMGFVLGQQLMILQTKSGEILGCRQRASAMAKNRFQPQWKVHCVSGLGPGHGARHSKTGMGQRSFIAGC
jgi:SLA1 homology domain 1, SHD1